MKRKLLLILLSLVCIFSFAFSFACNKEEKSSVKIVDIDLGELKVDSSLSIEQYRSGIISVVKTEIAEDIVWESSNTNVVTVDNDGVIYGIGVGSANVIATAGKYSASCLVTVNQSNASFVAKVNQSALNMTLDETFTIKASTLWDITEEFGVNDGVKFSWESKDTEIASVTDNLDGTATVIALSEGLTNISLRAEFRGKTVYYPNGISVSVNKVAPVIDIVNFDSEKGGFSKTIYLYEKIAGDNSNSAVPELSVFYKDKEVEDYSISWENDASSAVQFDSFNGSVVSKGIGTSKITAQISFTPQGESEVTAVISIDVSVIKAVKDLGVQNKMFVASNRTYAYNDDNYNTEYTISGIDDGEIIVGFTANGKTISELPLLSGGLLKISSKAFSYNDTYNITIETNKKYYTAQIEADVINFAISNLDELMGWYSKDNYAKNTNAKIVILEDIDCEKTKFQEASFVVNSYWWPSSGRIDFVGSIDGRGHAIYNFQTVLGFLPGVGEGATICNLAVVDYVNLGSGSAVGGIYFSGSMTNCYFECSQTSIDKANDFTGFYSQINSSKASIKNVVVIAHERSENGQANYGAFKKSSSQSVSGLYVVNDCYNGLGHDSGFDLAGLHVYSSGSLMMEDLDNQLPTAFTKKTNSDYWTLYDGMVLFNNQVVKDRYDALKTAVGISDVVINTANFESENQQSVAHIGDSIKLESNISNGVWTIGLQENQYTLEKNVLTLTENATVGQTFNVYVDAVKYGYFGFNGQIQAVVGAEVEKVTLDAGESFVAKNRPLSGVGIDGFGTNDIVKSLFVDGARVDETLATKEGTVVTIPNSLFSGSNYGKANIVVKTIDKVYSTDVYVYDYVLGNAEELDKWYTEYTTSQVDYDKYIILDNDIKADSTKTYGFCNYWFKGVFDGKGHTIDGLKTSNGLIYKIEGTVKNISLINTITTCWYMPFVFYYAKEDSIISNIYYQGYQGTNTNDFTSANQVNGFCQYCYAKTLENIVVIVDRVTGSTSDPVATIAIDCNSLYVVNTYSKGVTLSTNAHYYKDTASFVNDIKATLPSSFSTDIWDTFNGIPVFKSAKTIYEGSSAGTGSLTIDQLFSDSKVLDVDDPLTLKADREDVVWYVEGLNEDAYIIKDGTLTLTDNAVTGTKFNIKAQTYVDLLYVLEDSILDIEVGVKLPLETLEERIVGQNQLSIDITVDNASDVVTKVLIDGVKSSKTYSNNDSVVAITTSDIGENGQHTIVVFTESKKYSLTFELVDVIISNSTEFINWYTNDFAKATSDYTKDVLLTADITLDSATKYTSGAKKFAGVFDGKGHTISNFTTTAGMFKYLDGEFKNTALINTKTYNASGSFVGDTIYDNAVMYNIYYQGTQGTGLNSKATTGFYKIVSNKALLENIVVIVDRTVGDKADPISQSEVDCTSLYVVVNTSSESTTSTKVNYYKTLAEMKTAVTKLPEDFDSDIWAINDNGELVFKSTIIDKD